MLTRPLTITCLIILNFLLQPLRADDVINFKEFEDYIVKAMDDWKTPGAAVAVVKDGAVVYLGTFGVKTVGGKDKVTKKTVFPIVSVTKSFTAAVVSKLVEEGKLSLDDPVVKFLPDFKLADLQVTKEFKIRDLLSHRSGLPGYAADSLSETGWSSEEIYKALHLIPLKTTFRQKYDYQNVFPGIAGMVIEKVTGKTLSHVYQEYLFDPLEMHTASIGENGVTSNDGWWARLKAKVKGYFSDTTHQHQQIDESAIVIKNGNPAIYCFESSRGINASIEDMSKWLMFQIGNGTYNQKQLLSPASIKEMRTAHVNVGPPQGGRQFPVSRVPDIDYGMGWFIHKYDRLNMIAHMGGMTGVRSLIAIAPEEKVGIVIIANMGGMRVSFLPEALRSKFFDMYLKLSDQPDWSQEISQEFNESRRRMLEQRILMRLKEPRPAKDFKDYVGKYSNPLYGEVKITQENNKLYMTYRTLKVSLEHWNANSFAFKPYEFSPSYSGNDLGELNFWFEKKEQAAALVVNLMQEGEDPVFLRTK